MTRWLLVGLAVYLSLGVAALFVGPLAKAYRQALKPPLRTDSVFEVARPCPPGPRWKDALFALVLGLGAVLLWPIMLASNRPAKLDPRLTFMHVGGSGTLTCQRCGHQEEVVGFLHGHGNGWSKTGLQCQTCGRLCTLERLEDGTGVPDFCDCPGEPSRDDPLFCPTCRSTDLQYLMSYIT